MVSGDNLSSAEREAPGHQTARFGGRLLVVTLLLAGAILASGLFYYQKQASEVRQNAQSSLAAVLDLKSAALENWLNERRGDLEIMRASLMVRSVLKDPTGAEIRQTASSRFDVWIKAYGYAMIAVVNAKGELLLKRPPDYPVSAEAITNYFRNALQSGEKTVMSVVRTATNQPPRLWLAGVSHMELQAATPPDGGFLALVDLRRFIYPFLKKWPTPSPSAETVLVEHIGDDAVLLNDLSNAPAVLTRIPIHSRSQALAVKILRGDPGLKVGETVEGVDARGSKVLAVTRWISGTPWLMVAKIDQDEVFAPLRKEAYELGIIGALTLAILLLCIRLLWKHEEQAQARSSAARFRTLIENAPTAIYINRHERSLYANEKFLHLYGYANIAELVGQSIYMHWAPESQEFVKDRVKKRAQGEWVAAEYEGTARRKDGSLFPVQVHITMVELPDGPAALAFIADITERKQAEETLRLQMEEVRLRNDELERFMTASTDRELRIIELKKEINEFLRKAGVPQKYRVECADPTSPELPT